MCDSFILNAPNFEGVVSLRVSLPRLWLSAGARPAEGAAREMGSIVLRVGGRTHRGGEPAPSPAETTSGSLGVSLRSVSSTLPEGAALPRRGRGRLHTTPEVPPARSRLASPGEKAASRLLRAVRGLPAWSPPGSPQPHGSRRPRPSFTKWRPLFVRRRRAPPLPSALPGAVTAPPPALRGEGPHRC